jgi:hypothetical protein
MPVSCADGVRHNPNSVSSVRRVDGTSWNNKRPCGVANGLQVRKHLVECHLDDSKNIFANDPSGSLSLNNCEHRWPEVTVILFACLLAGATKGLAGESSCNDVASDSLAWPLGDVVNDWHTWPVLLQNSPCIFFTLAKCDCFPAHPLSGQSKAANAREKVKVSHGC